MELKTLVLFSTLIQLPLVMATAEFLKSVCFVVCHEQHSDFQSMYHDRQGVAVVPPTVPGAFLGIPEKGTMKKQKSIGMTYVQQVCLCVRMYTGFCCLYITTILFMHRGFTLHARAI